MICYHCSLPDPYRGQGDGIGSCDCPRCECCQAAPHDCDCDQPFDYLGDEDLEAFGDDYLCNDVACPTRIARRERAGAAVEGGTP